MVFSQIVVKLLVFPEDPKSEYLISTKIRFYNLFMMLIKKIDSKIHKGNPSKGIISSLIII